MIKKTISISVLFGVLVSCISCSNNDKIVKNNALSLEEFLKVNADYVHNINGFYIVGSAAKPKEATPNTTTGKEVFDHSVRLFSSFLDRNNDGVVDDDKKDLNKWLAQKTMFISGPLNMVDKISEASQVTGNGIYGMSMQTDNWPYVKDYNGKGWTLDKLSSSTWRPSVFNALWEEVFHTVTEAISRTDAEFAFTSAKKLRQFMEDDIAAGTYDISEQNTAENGNYDKITAVNEYIHQIWAINFAGLSDKLNTHQKKALEFMKTKKVPMSIEPAYSKIIGIKIK